MQRLRVFTKVGFLANDLPSATHEHLAFRQPMDCLNRLSNDIETRSGQSIPFAEASPCLKLFPGH
jgi:hypothetical protein